MTHLKPTFSESWHKVAGLSPRLRTTVHVYRQQFRGRTWHVARDAANNQHFRFSVPGYFFLALLDGRRTVADAWTLSNDRLGDDAPTQNEVIQLLGQLYASNLLYCELPGDSEQLFNRYRKRIHREIKGRLSSILFAKIPLLNPDHILNRWVWLFGCAFTWYGAAAATVLLTFGLAGLAGHGDALFSGASGVLSQDNLPWLYLCFVLTKVLHEFGHGFACKRFGRQNGTGGDVHEMGIMLLVFTPVPYVDASSAWSFRSKWQRIVVGAAGMLVEFAIAGVAALVWVNTPQGTLTSALAYNVLFISGASTLLFNANPLLRYDGYYILSDALEIPNLASRSRQYIYYLVKRYAWGIKTAVNPASAREHGWLFVYAIASTVYRTMVAIAIIWFIADKFFFIGAILAVGAVVTMMLVPILNLIRYLVTSNELARVRRRAVGTMGATVAGAASGLCLIPVPDHLRADGVVEPRQIALIHARADGFVRHVAPSVSPTTPLGAAIVDADSPRLTAELDRLAADKRATEIRGQWAVRERDVAAAQVFEEQIAALDDQIIRTRKQLASLEIHAPFAGTWISPKIENLVGAYLRRGESIGMVADLSDARIRATADQFAAAILVTEAHPEVEIRARSHPDLQSTGTIAEISPAAQEQLPARSLGVFAGGGVETSAEDPSGRIAATPYFEVRIDPADAQVFYPGQRVVVRFTLPAKPLAWQWWRSIEQLVQRRFRI